MQAGINRLRQDLAWQFPEIAKVKFNQNGDRLSLALRWLAGENKIGQSLEENKKLKLVHEKQAKKINNC